MTLKTRIIPCLDVKDGRVVKGVKFLDLVDAGDPVEAAKAYDAAGADELCFLDITASHEDRGILLDVVTRTAEACFMPLTVGGGVRKVEDIRALLLAGADKVSINTAAVTNRGFVREAAEKFGDQCIVVAIDAKQVVARPLGDLHPWRAQRHRARRDRFRPRGRLARRGRAAGHLDGPRRHQDRLRSRPDLRHRRRRPGAGDRLRRRRRSRRSRRRACARATPRRCSPPRSSISAPTRFSRPRRIWRRPAWRCGWIETMNVLAPRHSGAPRSGEPGTHERRVALQIGTVAALMGMVVVMGSGLGPAARPGKTPSGSIA